MAIAFKYESDSISANFQHEYTCTSLLCKSNYAGLSSQQTFSYLPPYIQIIVPKYVPAFCWYYTLGAPRPSSVVAARRPTTAAAMAKPSDQLTKGRTTFSLPCMHRACIRICKYNLSPSLVLSCLTIVHIDCTTNWQATIEQNIHLSFEGDRQSSAISSWKLATVYRFIIV